MNTHSTSSTPPASDNDLGERIHAARVRSGLTLAMLGEKIGISGQAVQQWEAGSSVPSYRNLRAVTALLGMEEPARPVATPAAPAILSELLMAELIILVLLAALTPEQTLAVHDQLDAAGLVGEDMSRRHERRAAITASGVA